jgi:predicted porin
VDLSSGTAFIYNLEIAMKTLKPTIISLVMAGVFSPPAVIADDNWVDVYGKVMLSLDKVDEDNGDDQWELNSNASRFGVKGYGDTGIDGLEVFYQMEWAVDITDESKEENISSRNQFIGVRGSFGQLLAGRHDTPAKSLAKSVDFFNDYQMEFKSAFNGEVRASNTVQYSTPKMGGLKAKIAIIPGEDTANNDGLADGISASVEYQAGKLTLGAAIDDGVEGNDVETLRAIAKYKINNFEFGFMYHDAENGNLSGDGISLSGKYKMDQHSFKLQLVDSDAWRADISSKAKYSSITAIGWDFKASKKTTFVSYLSFNEEGVTGNDDTIFGVGVAQKF